MAKRKASERNSFLSSDAPEENDVELNLIPTPFDDDDDSAEDLDNEDWDEAEEDDVDSEDDNSNEEDTFVDDTSTLQHTDPETNSDNENDHEKKYRLRIWRRRARPEITPIYDSDTSDEETTNTIGNVPLEWYKDLPHIGYDVNGNKILKPEGATQDELDAFLENVDNKNAWRKVLNKLEGKEVELGKEELEIMARIQKNQFPLASFDPEIEALDITPESVMPLSGAPEPKRRFIPSKNEASMIMKIARAIRKGLITPGMKRPKKPERPQVYDLWGQSDESTTIKKDHIPAPKVALPHHMESYNPPAEYLFTPEEKKEWEDMDPEDRPQNFVPQKYDSLRKVPGYSRFIQEQFDRCLDLYLCPRMIKNKLDIDPESLIPKLPSPKELHPFPHKLSITYKGHTGRVRSISVDPTGQYLASGSDDKTIRIWEVSSGRCLYEHTVDEVVMSLSWNPLKHVVVLAACVGDKVVLLTPKTGAKKNQEGSRQFLEKAVLEKEGDDARKSSCSWSFSGSEANAGRIAAQISLPSPATQVVWHKKGDYFATVSQAAGAEAVQIHQLSKAQSQSPFNKSKGLVQKVLFHPSKPILFVATQRYVKMYNLVKQELLKTLLPGCKWISSMDIHRGGDNLIVGSYDCRVYWFDMDLSLKPYKTLRYHKSAVRNVTYHPRYPLFSSCSDDGSALVFHGTVYNDLMQNPLIVPLKSLKGAHTVVDHLGALDIVFHPGQPWLFTAGADGLVKLYCSS